MKFGIALLFLLVAIPLCAKDYTIEDKFNVTLPDESTSKSRPDDAPLNTGYPKVHGPGFQFMSYWWLWVERGASLDQVPKRWQARRPEFTPHVSDLREFTTDSGI